MEYVVVILTGWLIGLIAAIPIGPVNLICIRRTLQFGWLYGFVSGLGAAVGDGIFACIAAFSLTAISQLIHGYSTPLLLIGGIMVVSIGIRMFFAPPPPRIGETYGPPTENASKACAHNGASPIKNGNGKNSNGKNGNGKMSLASGMATTFALTMTNPITFAGFVGWSAGLGGLSDELRFFQAAFWVIGVILGSATWWLTLTAVVGKLHARIDDRVVQIINRVSGVLVTLFGLVVLLHLARTHFFS